MIEDRTKAHADHVGHGHERITTAAVGKKFYVLLSLHIYFTAKVDYLVKMINI